MTNASLIAGLLLVFFTIGWIMVKASAWIRVCFALFTISLAAHCAYVYGRASERLFCLGTYVRSFERYSTMLATLAREGHLQELAENVVAFDKKWKRDLQSRDHLDAIVTEVEQQTMKKHHQVEWVATDEF